MRSHEIRVGTYKQDIWRTERGKKREKLTRTKENPNKVLLDSIFLHGFKMELFYYKDRPEYLYLGQGEKSAILNDYEVKAVFRMMMKAGNRMRVMGKYNNNNMIKEFKRLMKEKNDKKDEDNLL